MQLIVEPRDLFFPSHLLVLIIDDDDARDIYVVALEFGKFGRAVVGDDVEASPEVIVTKLTLPDGDGWDVLHSLKHDPHTCDIPVVVLTNCTTPALRDRAQREGCAGLIVNPGSPDELASQLQELVDRSLFVGDVSTIN